MTTYPTGGSREQHYPSDRAKPLVSIVIVTLNAEACLRTCLLSIINQQYKNIELLVFDGLSTDSTLEIIKEYDTHISYWQSRPDQGIYDAMNKAIQKASGDWIYFIGADDKLLSGFSELAAQLKNRNTLYYGMCEPLGILFTGKYSRYKLSKYGMNQQALLYPTAVLKGKGYDTRYRVYADYAINIEIWGNESIPKKYYPIVIAEYNMTGFSSYAKDEFFKADKPSLVRKHLGWLTYIRYLYKRNRELRKPESTFF
ncbi:glycosyltransferase family 2 protein [Arcticibacter pallidicorallinus]|nr:glycosyltransferase family 2 protein [Arcticibacter pallidicorallinus]